MEAITLEQVSLTSPEQTLDPFPYFAKLRSKAPILWNERHKGWLVTRYVDVQQGYRDSRLSSNRLRPVLDRLHDDEQDTVGKALRTLQLWMVFQDEPDHKRLRGIVHKAFTPQAVAAMEAEVVTVARHQLNEVIKRLDSDPVDLLADFANRIPQRVICSMLGISEEHQEDFAYWTEELSSVVGGVEDPERNQRAYRAMEFLEKRVAEVIANTPSNQSNLIANLVVAEQDNNRLTREEVVATAILMLFGGRGTTASMIVNSLRALLRHPQQYEEIKADPSLITNAVEEVLRWEGHTKLMPRISTETFEWHGQSIQKGDRLFLCNLSANRDQDQFEDPDTFDIHRRNAGRHIAFGTGIHLCLGQSLARLQLRNVLREALMVLPPLKLVKPEGDWSRALLRRSQDSLLVERA